MIYLRAFFPHWWFEEDGLIVINVQQRHLQRLSGLVGHWLAHVPGHDDQLKRLEALSQRLSRARSPTRTVHSRCRGSAFLDPASRWW